MCIFQSGKDIPTVVRISLRTLQYLVIPLMSLSILVVGSMYTDKCESTPLLPVWHIVAGASGILTPIFYLLFDEINPRLSQRSPALSECIDNLVVFLLPLYIIFEVGWLITGTVWIAGSDLGHCDHTIYIFSVVVIVNFWIHILTPLMFMLGLCCTRIFPFCGYCSYWNIMKKAMDKWTRGVRMLIAFLIAVPLSIAMIATGSMTITECKNSNNSSDNPTVNSSDQQLITFSDKSPSNLNDLPSSPTKSSDIISPSYQSVEDKFLTTAILNNIHIPMWLIVAGSILLFVPLIYFIYDKYCKDEGGGPLIKNIANFLVIFYLLCGLVWAVVGFVWVFGSHSNEICGSGTFPYEFAFGTLITLNCIMDIWICFKICVVLYWAFLSDD